MIYELELISKSRLSWFDQSSTHTLWMLKESNTGKNSLLSGDYSTPANHEQTRSFQLKHNIWHERQPFQVFSQNVSNGH